MREVKQRLPVRTWLRRIAVGTLTIALDLGIVAAIFYASAFLIGVLLGLFPSLQAIERGFWLFISAVVALILIGSLIIVDQRKWRVATRLRRWREGQ